MTVVKSTSTFLAVWTGFLFPPSILRLPPSDHRDGLLHLEEGAVKGKWEKKFGF